VRLDAGGQHSPDRIVSEPGAHDVDELPRPARGDEVDPVVHRFSWEFGDLMC
jgi:hypothetical protein